MASKVSISTGQLTEHAGKVTKFTSTIDDLNSKLNTMTTHLNSIWVDTNCQTFCTSVSDLQQKQIKSFHDSLVELKTYMEKRAKAYEDAFTKIKSAHK